MGAVSPATHCPAVWRLGEVASCLDTAWRLARRGRLEPWDSVQVVSQTDGRGQLRRHWQSPPGNIYAALRLPMASPFDGTAAALAVALLLAEGLRAEGWPVGIKWPNDLVLEGIDGQPRKVAGILLEEREGILLAGVGVNLVWAPEPEALRDGAALMAACLAGGPTGGGRPAPQAEKLWPCLVKRAHSAYVKGDMTTRPWLDRAAFLLLWRGALVELLEGSRVVARGALMGLGASGGVLLEGADQEFFSGSLRRVG